MDLLNLDASWRLKGMSDAAPPKAKLWRMASGVAPNASAAATKAIRMKQWSPYLSAVDTTGASARAPPGSRNPFHRSPAAPDPRRAKPPASADGKPVMNALFENTGFLDSRYGLASSGHVAFEGPSLMIELDPEVAAPGSYGEMLDYDVQPDCTISGVGSMRSSAFLRDQPVYGPAKRGVGGGNADGGVGIPHGTRALRAAVTQALRLVEELRAENGYLKSRLAESEGLLAEHNRTMEQLRLELADLYEMKAMYREHMARLYGTPQVPDVTPTLSDTRPPQLQKRNSEATSPPAQHQELQQAQQQEQAQSNFQLPVLRQEGPIKAGPNDLQDYNIFPLPVMERSATCGLSLSSNCGSSGNSSRRSSYSSGASMSSCMGCCYSERSGSCCNNPCPEFGVVIAAAVADGTEPREVMLGAQASFAPMNVVDEVIKPTVASGQQFADFSRFSRWTRRSRFSGPPKLCEQVHAKATADTTDGRCTLSPSESTQRPNVGGAPKEVSPSPLASQSALPTAMKGALLSSSPPPSPSSLGIFSFINGWSLNVSSAASDSIGGPTTPSQRDRRPPPSPSQPGLRCSSGSRGVVGSARRPRVACARSLLAGAGTMRPAEATGLSLDGGPAVEDAQGSINTASAVVQAASLTSSCATPGAARTGIFT